MSRLIHMCERCNRVDADLQYLRDEDEYWCMNCLDNRSTAVEPGLRQEVPLLWLLLVIWTPVTGLALALLLGDCRWLLLGIPSLLILRAWWRQ